MRTFKFRTETSQKKLDAICKLIEENGEMRISDIEKTMGVARNSLYYFMNHLRDHGRVHVSGFKLFKNKDSRIGKQQSKAAVFRIGSGKDLLIKKGASFTSDIKNSDDRKIIMKRAIDVPFVKNTDPLMQAFYGL